MLSEGRAKALVNYLLPRFPFLQRIIQGGIWWRKLGKDYVKWLQSLTWQKMDGILHIIDHIPVEINYRTNTSRKKSLMLYKQGNPYRFMLREYYPHLRKAICKIEYDVQNLI